LRGGQGWLRLVRSVIAAGAGGAGPYTLNCGLGVLHVLSGMVEVAIGDNAFRLGPGDTLTSVGGSRIPGSIPMIRSAAVLW
jgi:hypothetical protein